VKIRSSIAVLVFLMMAGALSAQRRTHQARPQPRQAQPAPKAAASAVKPITAPASPSVPGTKTDPALGEDMGAGFRTCLPGDSSAAGAVLAGYKKVIAQTMFGQNCRWEPVQ
jgi:hypothetical protein